MEVSNIFDLVHHFGNEEDQVSANFGFVLQTNRKTLDAFLRRLKIEPDKKHKIDIETQVRYGDSIIDLVLKDIGPKQAFIVFLESKIKGGKLGRKQLVKYARILNKEYAFYQKIRLVYITQFDRKSEFAKINLSLKKNEFNYFRWGEMVNLLRKFGHRRFINNLFLQYIGDTMSDKRIITDRKIKEVEEVLIASTRPEFWDCCRAKSIVFQSRTARDAQYVAFYRTKPVSAITHIGKVKYTENNVPPKETLKGFPKVARIARQKSWYNRPHKVYHLESIKELPYPIKKGKGGSVRVTWYKPIVRLMSALTLDDLQQTKDKVRKNG